MTLCNPVQLDFSPGGPLKVGQTYKIVYTAYATTNEGEFINGNETIGTKEQSFTMPTNLETPKAMVRVVSHANSVEVSMLMYDSEKTIYNGEFYIDVYDLNDNLITNDTTRKTVTVTQKSNITYYTGVIDNLPSNGSYKIVVTAPTDRNNDGVVDYTYRSELMANTISTANASLSIKCNPSGYLEFKIQDLANFTNVDKIVYSIDSDDGSINYENATKSLAQWTQLGNAYSYTTSFVPDSGDYYCTLQFYNGSMLIGSISGRYTK
jgi:hypothetical protein